MVGTFRPFRPAADQPQKTPQQDQYQKLVEDQSYRIFPLNSFVPNSPPPRYVWHLTAYLMFFTAGIYLVLTAPWLWNDQAQQMLQHIIGDGSQLFFGLPALVQGIASWLGVAPEYVDKIHRLFLPASPHFYANTGIGWPHHSDVLRENAGTEIGQHTALLRLLMVVQLGW